MEDLCAMDPHDDEPELAGYEPTGDRPLRSRRMRRMMQVVVVIGLVGLILPGIVTTVSVGARTAEAACAIWVAYEEPGAAGSDARFQVFGPGEVVPAQPARARDAAATSAPSEIATLWWAS